MDTSKEYIRMCDCPEIQEQWKAMEGDFYTIKHPEGVRPTWVLDVEGIREYEEDYLPDAKRIPYKYVFLPRQDQIQEMVRKDYENTLDMLCDFYAVITVDQPTGFQQMFEVSMEQLWLVFYMYEKHNKAWDGKKWGQVK